MVRSQTTLATRFSEPPAWAAPPKVARTSSTELALTLQPTPLPFLSRHRRFFCLPVPPLVCVAARKAEADNESVSTTERIRRFARLPRNRRLFILPSCKHTALKLLCPRMASSLCATFLSVAASLSRSSFFRSRLLRHLVPATRFGAPRSRFSRPPNPWRTLTGGLPDDCPRYAHLGLVGSRRFGALCVHPYAP